MARNVLYFYFVKTKTQLSDKTVFKCITLDVNRSWVFSFETPYVTVRERNQTCWEVSGSGWRPWRTHPSGERGGEQSRSSCCPAQHLAHLEGNNTKAIRVCSRRPASSAQSCSNSSKYMIEWLQVEVSLKTLWEAAWSPFCPHVVVRPQSVPSQADVKLKTTFSNSQENISTYKHLWQ